MLPNWIIIGVPKASTSSLFRWLADHPQADGPAEKETYYFVDPGTHMSRPDCNFRDHGLAGYRALFADCDPSARVLVEATPSYIYSDTALRELPGLPSEPRFIVVLREPVAQIRSLFAYFQQNWSWIPAGMSFRSFIETVERGEGDFRGNELAASALTNAWYSDHLRKWTNKVGSDRLEILLFDDLVKDSRGTMRKLAATMGIDPDFYDRYDFPIENPTYVARSQLLQRFNIWLRERLPKGAAYRLARSAYRALNTRRPDPAERDLETEAELKRRFEPMLDELEADHGLDVGKWRNPAAQPFPAGHRTAASPAPATSGLALDPAAGGPAR